MTVKKQIKFFSFVINSYLKENAFTEVKGIYISTLQVGMWKGYHGGTFVKNGTYRYTCKRVRG